VIEAFFFGPDEQQIFAAYHPPAGSHAQMLTVICPPLFSEYMRTHLALRELAVRLAASGQHVVRFDYRGTGDSFGDLGEVTVSDWLEDIALTVQEARDLCGSTFVQLLGIRAGALLACKAAGASHEVRRLVLWDPVPDGATYLEALRRVQTGILRRNPYLSRSERRGAKGEYGGHRLGERMVAEFQQLDASVYAGVPKPKLHVVYTSPTAIPALGVATEPADCRCDWGTDREEVILPQPILARLAACLMNS
jgi:alpha-beta hydrolase superfamily lysophospholipase